MVASFWQKIAYSSLELNHSSLLPTVSTISLIRCFSNQIIISIPFLHLGDFLSILLCIVSKNVPSSLTLCPMYFLLFLSTSHLSQSIILILLLRTISVFVIIAVHGILYICLSVYISNGFILRSMLSAFRVQVSDAYLTITIMLHWFTLISVAILSFWSASSVSSKLLNDLSTETFFIY